MTEGSGKRYSLDDLLAVMARLRDTESGCPWDIEQNFSTIAPYTIEEAYEVADAIEREDFSELKDELGDLLFQVVYHAQMASEENRFAFGDVVDAITRKMVRRHPHVFGDGDREEFLAKNLWRQIKEEEKAARGSGGQPSRFDDIPLALPALTRAVKLQKRAAEVGFDWSHIACVVAKAEEEIAELKAALVERDGDAESDRTTRVCEEFGDLLFVMANMARHLGVDPEAALRDANAKFLRRFASVEDALAQDGRKAEDATLEEMDRLWDKAKDSERNKT